MHKFNPEPLESLKARYLEATKDLYIQLDVQRGIRVRPCSRLECRFDFLDGVRLIISKEQQPSGRLVIHISGSIHIDDETPDLNDTYIHHIVEHFALVSGLDKALELIGISNMKVVHFYLRMDN